MGLVLANGVPYFAFGATGKIFRSPFGQKSSQKTNVLWGLSNFAAATVIGAALAFPGDYEGYSLAALLGFWLTKIMFGLRIKRFLND